MAKKKEPRDSFSSESVDYKEKNSLSAYLLSVLKQVGHPVTMDAILRITKLPRKAKKHIEAALYTMQDEGSVLRASGGWSAPKKLVLATGTLAVQRAGMGFVTPEHGPDIYIHPAAMSDAWHGDTVEVLVLPGRRGPNREGRITRVLHRGHQELPVHAVKSEERGRWICAPATDRIPVLFLTDTAALEKPVQKGDLLLVRPGEKLAPNLWAAEATLNLEHEETPAAQERITKSEHGIPSVFPKVALNEADTLPENPDEGEFSGRGDLRHLDFVTIDGSDARDFDDAIQVEQDTLGFRLRVAIADVSHYVHEQSALDAEARLRGNSYYFPMSVEPMLPERLSNGLCSLRPMVPRLAMVADMRFSVTGSTIKSDFYPAVIESKARLTYNQIEQALFLKEPEARDALIAVLPMLEKGEALARLLQKNRNARGGLDFDVPEPLFRIGENGELIEIVPRNRHFGHRMIEECMIAANEAVASFLEKQRVPTLYRVHQPPDPEKLSSVLRYIEQTGLAQRAALPLPGKAKKGGKAAPVSRKTILPSQKDLQRILVSAKETGQEYVLTNLLLRSMMQARYQSENTGHYGLASKAYCHFTSPIRRYADLIVHRTLKRALGIETHAAGRPLSEVRLDRIAEHINETERTAVAAEREIHKRLAILYLKDKVGEAFDGVISGVTEFGFFVELTDILSEGMVRFSALESDFFEYVPDRREVRGIRSGKRFMLGQNIRVTVLDVNLGRLEVNLVLAGEDAIPANKGTKDKKSGRPKKFQKSREDPKKTRKGRKA